MATTSLAINPTLQPKLTPKNPRTELAPVGIAYESPFALLVSKDVPPRSLEEFVAGAQMRCRAVMMTSIAFVLGLAPLVIAHGVAQISRRGIGRSVFAGMIGASTLGIFVIPMLYVVFQRLCEKKWRRAKAPSGVSGHGLA